MSHQTFILADSPVLIHFTDPKSKFWLSPDIVGEWELKQLTMKKPNKIKRIMAIVCIQRFGLLIAFML